MNHFFDLFQDMSFYSWDYIDLLQEIISITMDPMDPENQISDQSVNCKQMAYLIIFNSDLIRQTLEQLTTLIGIS